MKLMIMIVLINFMMIMTILSQKLVSIGALLMISASVVTMLTSFFSSSWYGFILFLIYITGLLVLFGYFLALSPNLYHTEKKYFKTYLMVSSPLIMMPILTLFNNMPMFKMNFETNVITLFSNMNIMIYLFMVIILLLMLLMVVSLTYKSPSPLRNYLS